jgi:hypothetical protein
MSEEKPSVAGAVTPFRATVALMFVALVAVGIYAYHERNAAKQLAEQNSAVTSVLKTTRDQMAGLNARLDAMNAERTTEKPEAHPGIYRKPLTAASGRKRIDDPRWKKIQGQLDDQAKQIDATRQDLTNTRAELQGSIATTHDELVMLAKKGERNYYEFDIDKDAQFQREGPVGVRLHKANTKHEYADLDLRVDDFIVSKKHVNIYEPVVFHTAQSKMPVELVINSISKNHIHGYVSEPKYKSAELEAMAASSAASATGSNSSQSAPAAKPSPARQRLEPPSRN